MGGKFHLKLNNGERPIANKYREGKMQRTLKRELKVLEIVKREAIGASNCLRSNQPSERRPPGSGSRGHCASVRFGFLAASRWRTSGRKRVSVSGGTGGEGVGRGTLAFKRVGGYTSGSQYPFHSTEGSYGT